MAKASYIGVDGIARKIKKMYVGVDGVARKVKKAYIGVAGVARLFYSSGFPLADLPEGSLINLNEGGTGVNFYLAKHDYESGLNGAGRELLVRKDVHSNVAWSPSSNAYATSNIDAWLTGTYKGTLDSTVQELIGATSFYYTTGNGNYSVTTLARSVFILSLAEFGLTTTGINSEGSALPIASSLLVSYLNGSATNQWTRSANSQGKTIVAYVNSSGQANNWGGVSKTYGARPCFTLPSDAIVNPTPNADGSYTLLV